MADSAFKTQVSKDENANSASNVLFHQIADDSGNVVTITGGALDVNATVTPENVYVDDSAFTVGTDQVGAVGFLADETSPDSVDEGDIGIARMTLDRKVLNVIVDPSTDGNRLGIHSDGSIKIGDGTESLLINADGSINVVVAGSPGTPVHDYDTATVAGAATSNHDYTVTGASTLSLTQVLFAASGKLKVEIQHGPLASLVTAAVAFIDQDSFGEYTFASAISVPDTTTGTVRVIRTNRQGGSQDVYTTIIGSEA
jgi:hypothetical protein